MELGPHADDVQDIVELVESGAIFQDPRPPLGTVRVIRDMAEVRRYLHVIADYEDDEGWDWRDLLEYGGEPGSDLIVERMERRDSVPGLIEGLGELMDGPIAGSLRRQLAGSYTEDDITFIWSTLDFILLYRATFGRTLPFIERLVGIYRLGGHPCGWVGRYPEGQLVAYFPPRDDTPEDNASGHGIESQRAESPSP
jgi:hypothetical protein